MKLNKRKPDYEAESVSIEADTITEPEKFRRSNDHQANRITAEGDVEISIRKQHPEGKNDAKRPKAGTTLSFPGKGRSVDVDARRIGKVDRGHGRERTSASMRVQIFLNRRRSRRCPATRPSFRTGSSTI